VPKKDEKSALKKSKTNYDDRIIAFVDIMGFKDMVRYDKKSIYELSRIGLNKILR